MGEFGTTFPVGDFPSLVVAGSTELNGGLTMDTNKFIVADGSGNTTIAGTLAVTGAQTLTGATYANGGVDRSAAAALAIGATNATSVVITPATTITGLLTCSGGSAITGDITLADGANRNIIVAPNATADANAAKSLLVHAGNKTAGTGNGGNLSLDAGTTAGGTQGSILIGGTAGATVTITPPTTVTGLLTATNGFKSTPSVLTTGTMTAAANGMCLGTWSKFTWTNAQVVALGAVGTGDITVCTLPAKTVVHHCFLVVDTQATFAAGTLTAAVGVTGADYTDFILDSSLKAAANTIYGNATTGELGSALWEGAGLTITPFYIPSWTGTTAVKMHLITGAGTLDGVTTCTGSIYLLTSVLP